MVRILDRMVAKAFLKLFVRSALGLPLLFILGHITENIDDFLDRGLTTGEIALGYVFLMPQYVLWSFPVAGLVAAVFTVNSMTSHSELVAAKSGGISFHRVIAPLVLMGALLTGAGLWMGTVVPTTTRRSAELFRERESRKEWRQQFVYQTEQGQTLTIQRLFAESASIEEVLIEVPNPDGTLRHVWADKGFFTEANGWTFHDGYHRTLTESGESSTYRFDRYQPRDLTTPPEDLLEEPREEEEMTYDELTRQAEAVFRSGGNPRGLLVKRDQQIAIPVATLIIILFGAPLATTVKRGGAAVGVGASLGSTILYMVLLRVFAAIGTAGALPPIWAAWIPNIIFLGAAVFLLARVRT